MPVSQFGLQQFFRARAFVTEVPQYPKDHLKNFLEPVRMNAGGDVELPDIPIAGVVGGDVVDQRPLLTNLPLQPAERAVVQQAAQQHQMRLAEVVVAGCGKGKLQVKLVVRVFHSLQPWACVRRNRYFFQKSSAHGASLPRSARCSKRGDRRFLCCTSSFPLRPNCAPIRRLQGAKGQLCQAEALLWLHGTGQGQHHLVGLVVPCMVVPQCVNGKCSDCLGCANDGLPQCLAGPQAQ